jgi:hypothetical protein
VAEPNGPPGVGRDRDLVVIGTALIGGTLPLAAVESKTGIGLAIAFFALRHE